MRYISFALMLLIGWSQTIAQTGAPFRTQARPVGTANTQVGLLQSGPMVGYVEMREALLWAQTTRQATVRFDYFEIQNPAKIYRTSEYITNQHEAYTARLIADEVQPGKTYGYRLYIDGREIRRPYKLQFKTPVNWRYRTTPPMLRFALGSCNFVNDPQYDRVGKPYGGNYEIFENIVKMEPDLMLWLGDNTYLREGDWYSRTGIHYRYTHTRSLAQVQPLLGGMPNYAIWDDHDYGPNDSNGSFRDKNVTLETFKLFWGNPTYGIAGGPGTTTTFERDDCQFFMLDNRYFSSHSGARGEKPTILGKEQLDWLIEALATSKATFKFVCIGGQVLSTAELFENYINIAPEERDYLLNAIVGNRIKNVIFLTGDRHHSELSTFSKNGIRIYDFTVSPLTALAYDPNRETNSNRIANTGFGARAFGMVEVIGAEGNRKLKLMLYDYSGKKVWEQNIEAQK